MNQVQTQLLNQAEIKLKITRLAYEIVENNIQERSIILAGIAESGCIVSDYIKVEIQRISKLKVESIRIQLDKQNPINCTIETSIKLNKSNIIIVDDVANSGRTLLYAIKPLLDTMPKRIQVAVLIDRKHKQFPVTADFVGIQLSTTLHDNIKVQIENNEIMGAFLQ